MTLLKKTTISEQKIQSKIIAKLQKEGWLCVKLIRTSVNGIPDLLCLRQGVTMFVEVKRPEGKLSELQKVRVKQLQEHGFEVKIWTDYNTDFIWTQ
jgi:Holliday junction resolvase